MKTNHRHFQPYRKPHKPRMARLMEKVTSGIGKTGEDLIKFTLQHAKDNKIPLKDGHLLVDFEMTERYSAEDKSAKDAILYLSLANGDNLKAWFNVKRSERGLQDHLEKHLSFLIPFRGPLIKKIRPAFKMDVKNSMEATIEYAWNKIQKVMALFIELHLMEASGDETLREKYNEKKISKYIIIR